MISLFLRQLIIDAERVDTMKRKVIIILSVIAALLLIWCILFAMDYRAVMNLQYPVIAQHVGVEGGMFRGFGWVVQIEQYHSTEFGWVTESVEIYLFGKLVGAAVT